MPKNMEAYYQEAGRAGRDGEEAECVLLFGTQDIMTNRFLIEQGTDVGREVEYDKLNAMVDYCNTGSCLRNYILDYFGQEKYEDDCNTCGNCKNDTVENDITLEAQKILSCVKRMNERFGMVLVADVLKGANTAKIREFGCDKLTTYGIMKDYSKETIKEIISFLVAENYLELAGDKYPILRLTIESYKVLKNEKAVTIKKVIPKEDPLAKSSSKSSRGTKGLRYPVDEALFNLLRETRLKLAKEQRVQPFMVFPDATLKHMSSEYPTTSSQLLDITGVGEHKLEKYGQVFIEAIKNYVMINNIQVGNNREGNGAAYNNMTHGQDVVGASNVELNNIDRYYDMQDSYYNDYEESYMESYQYVEANFYDDLDKSLNQEVYQDEVNGINQDMNQKMNQTVRIDLDNPTKGVYGNYYDESNKRESLDINTTHKELKKSSTTKGNKASHITTYEMYKEGKTITKIANERNLSQNTIESHLIKCVEEGMEIDFDDFIPKEYEGQIIETINICGSSLLKPIKELLPQEVSYTAIKFAIAKINKSQSIQ